MGTERKRRREIQSESERGEKEGHRVNGRDGE